MSEGKKIKYHYKEMGPFRAIYSCDHPDVEERDFKSFLSVPQCVREICPAKKAQALCEVCEHFGHRKEFVSASGQVRTLYSGEHKDISENE